MKTSNMSYPKRSTLADTLSYHSYLYANICHKIIEHAKYLNDNICQTSHTQRLTYILNQVS